MVICVGKILNKNVGKGDVKMKKISFALLLGIMILGLSACGHKHVEVIDEEVPATCTESGLTEGSHCSECGKVLIEQVVIEAKGHNVVDDDEVQPTCSSNGMTKGSHCSVCNEVFEKQELIDKTEHEIVIDEAVEATTKETGLTEGKHCAICGEIIVEQEIVPVIETFEAGYCAGDLTKIGQKFSSFHVAGKGFQYSPASQAILLKQKYPLNSPGIGAYYESWLAYADYNGYGSYVGVYNDIIVFNIVSYEVGVKVSDAFEPEVLDVEPLILYGYDDDYNVIESILIWKRDNGYSVNFCGAKEYPNGSYLDENIKCSISTTDLMHIYGLPQKVIDANPAF